MRWPASCARRQAASSLPVGTLPRSRPAELDRFRGLHIGIVLQRLHLIASLTVMDNLLLAQYLAGAPQDRRRAGAGARQP